MDRLGTNAMLIIRSLDPLAKICWSNYTERFYVNARISISDGCIISGITQHMPSPEQAALAFLGTMQGAQAERRVVVDERSDRRAEYQWNGAAFVRCPKREAHQHS